MPITSSYSSNSSDHWQPNDCDVIVKWFGPGPRRQDLRELFSEVGSIRMIIIRNETLDYERRDAVIRYVTSRQARQAQRKFDGVILCDVELDVTWGLAEQAWGGRPGATDPEHCQMDFKFVEYKPYHPEVSQRTMAAWKKEDYTSRPERRHGVPVLDWCHDSVSRIDVHKVVPRKKGAPQGASTEPRNHPREICGKSVYHHLPYASMEETIGKYWEVST
mmetsp:Transcript_90895/g.166848  ORF Transcript_90895/g.166848 Transcript_90895/m.166848 type:complete len:219 (+) Transcript_90895:78-734(+)